MNILNCEILIMVVTGLLIIATIFAIIAEITSVRVKPYSDEDFKQGISVAIVMLVGGIVLYGALFCINNCFTDMRENAAYEEDVRQRNIVARNKANELEKLNTAPKEYERILNGIKADHIGCWEDYLRNTDRVTVYVDNTRKVVRIIIE